MSKSPSGQGEPATRFASLPIRLEQRASRAAAISRLLLLAPAALALSIPLGLVAVRAASEPHTLALLAERPVASLQIALGLILWAALFILPARHVLARLFTRRQIVIDRATVRIEQRSALETRSWQGPLASYLGLAHHVRASLSGLAHEIVLVHPDPRRNVTLLVADRVTQRTLDEAKALLGLPEVSPQTLYRLGRGQRRRQAAAPATPLQPARA